MNGNGEGWWMIGCAGSGQQDKWRITDHVMLRFRPIAPKPENPVNGGFTAENENNKSSLLATTSGSRRSKRRYIRVSNSTRRGRKRSQKGAPLQVEEEPVKASANLLQLLPETTTGDENIKKTPVRGSEESEKGKGEEEQNVAFWLSLRSPNFSISYCTEPKNLSVTTRMVIETWVMVECVTVTDGCTTSCMDIDAVHLGSNDSEKIWALDADACPGFISDGEDNVYWTNSAYKKLVTRRSSEKGLTDDVAIIVRLVIKEKIPYMRPYFTCRVRMEYTWKKDKWWQMMPCDVWRMECGGFAWRLDTQAALCLGRWE